jgi:hypothetical protein
MVKTGIASRDITPQESVPLFGYGDRIHDSTGIHDPLSVYAWWLESDGQALAREAAALSSIPGLTGERLLVSTTHTHSGPETLAVNTDGRPWAGAYYRLLVERTAEALIEASSRARACTIEVREAAGSLGVNRRDPRKPVDPRIVILSLIGEDGRLQGALFHYSCHLTVLGVDNYLVSADWAGPVRSSLEAELGVPVAYLQGAEGNIDPFTRGFLDMSDPDQARGSSFDVLAELLGVPAAEVPEGRNINALVKQRCRALGLPREEVRRLVASQFAYGNFLVTYAGGREAVQPRQGIVRLPCRILDFGSLCVLGAPAEILVEAAFDWQRRLVGRTALLAGLAGGWLGYMPHGVNFEEAEAGERYETVSTVFSPSACKTMLDGAQSRATGGSV